MTKLSRITVAAVVLALIPPLSACSGASGPSADQQTSGARSGHTGSAAPAGSANNGSVVTLDGTDGLRFTPSTITVHGLRVTVRFVDTSSYPHNLQVPALHFTSATVTGDPGQQATTFTLHFPHPGTYPFVCTYHSSAGMRGKFSVTG